MAEYELPEDNERTPWKWLVLLAVILWSAVWWFR